MKIIRHLKALKSAFQGGKYRRAAPRKANTANLEARGKCIDFNLDVDYRRCNSAPAVMIQDPLTQHDLFAAVIEKHPEVLRHSVYKPLQLPKPLYKMGLEEKVELFKAALEEMLEQIRSGDSPEKVAYDSDSLRLWSFGLQPMWEVCSDKSESRLLGLESLMALHCGSWGVGPILDVIEHLLNNDLSIYLQFKKLEVDAALSALENYPALPTISVNLRPSEWLLPEVQELVRDASRCAPGRIAFELTEYTNDAHFPLLFGEEGSLFERLTRKLLPVLRGMKKEGVVILADDLMPACVYHFEGEEECRRGERLSATHATECEAMLSEEWREVFTSVKFGIDWAIHALRLSKDSGADYAKVPLFVRGIKDNPKHVAAVTDRPVPCTEEEQVEALKHLQEAAASQLKSALTRTWSHFEALPVLEGTVPAAAVQEWSLQGAAKEQGGMFFEARFPPEWFLGMVH
jgi:hypothetical protein